MPIWVNPGSSLLGSRSLDRPDRRSLSHELDISTDTGTEGRRGDHGDSITARHGRRLPDNMVDFALLLNCA